MGLEPMKSLVQGMEERLSKGVLPLPFVFYTAPGSAYWGFRPPSSAWLVEATKRLADVFMPYALKILQAQSESIEDRPSAPSFANCLLLDEVQYRFQQMMGV